MADEDDTRPAWSRALVRLTEASGLTQAEVARRAGLQRDAFSRYVTGKSRPPPQKVIALAQALGVRPSEIDPDRPGLDEAADASAPGGMAQAAGARPLYRLTAARGGDPARAYLEVAADLPLEVAKRIIDMLAQESAA